MLLGQCYPNGEEPAIGRVAALDAGLPVEVPGLQLDRRCGSGLTAVMIAAMEVQTGVADLALAGGAESMSRAEHYTMGLRWGRRQGPLELQDRLIRLHKALFLDASPAPTKFAMAHLGLMAANSRLPIAACAEEVKREILAAMEEAF